MIDGIQCLLSERFEREQSISVNLGPWQSQGPPMILRWMHAFDDLLLLKYLKRDMRDGNEVERGGKDKVLSSQYLCRSAR